MFVTQYKDWYIKYDDGNGLWAGKSGLSTILDSRAIRFLQVMKYISSCSRGTFELDSPFLPAPYLTRKRPVEPDQVYEHDLLLRTGMIAVEGVRVGGPRETHHVFRLAYGDKFLEQIPVRLLIRNLISGMCYKAYRKEEWDENWLITADRRLWETTAFYMSKLPLEDAPEFLVHEYPRVSRLVKELLKI